MKFRLPSLFAAAFACASLSEAATMAYVQDFSTTATGDNVPAGFTEGGTAGTTTAGNSTNSQIVPFGADNGYQMAITSNNTAFSSIPITNVSTADGQGFTFSAQFKLDTIAANGGGSTAMTNNIVFLASSTDLSAGTNYRLGYSPAGLSSGGRLTLTEIGAAANFNVVPGQGTQGTANGSIDSSGTLATSTSVTYTISVTAWYTGTTLNLTGTLTDGTNTISVGATDTSPRTGTNFGMRIASNSASNTETVIWDNFSVQPYAIPEPATLAIFASGAVLLFGRRRHR